jgi:hypothetical protein
MHLSQQGHLKSVTVVLFQHLCDIIWEPEDVYMQVIPNCLKLITNFEIVVYLNRNKVFVLRKRIFVLLLPKITEIQNLIS